MNAKELALDIYCSSTSEVRDSYQKKIDEVIAGLRNNAVVIGGTVSSSYIVRCDGSFQASVVASFFHERGFSVRKLTDTIQITLVEYIT